MLLKGVRTPVAAERAGTRVALIALQFAPTADARRTHPEPLASLSVRQPLRHRRQNPNPKINR